MKEQVAAADVRTATQAKQILCGEVEPGHLFVHGKCGKCQLENKDYVSPYNYGDAITFVDQNGRYRVGRFSHIVKSGPAFGQLELTLLGKKKRISESQVRRIGKKAVDR